MKTNYLGRLIKAIVPVFLITTLIISKPYTGVTSLRNPQRQVAFASKSIEYSEIKPSLAGTVYGDQVPSPEEIVQVLAAASSPRPKVITTKVISATPASTPTERVLTSPKPVSVPSDILGLIDTYATQYKVDKNAMIGIAQCESGFNPDAVGSGVYGGLYQFVISTWVSNRQAMGLDPDPALRFDPEEAVKTAAFKMSRDGFGAWPVCGSRV